MDLARPVRLDLAQHGLVPDAKRARGSTAHLQRVSLDSGQGFEFDIEYKIKPKVGLVLTGIFTDMEGNFIYGTNPGEENTFSSDPNTVDFYTINGGVNYHFTPESRVDFYLGAFAGVFSYDSVTFRLPDIDQEIKINFDDQFSYGLKRRARYSVHG